MTNPFIAESCSHYPKKLLADVVRNARVWLGLPMQRPCDCGDCFYCDNPDD